MAESLPLLCWVVSVMTVVGLRDLVRSARTNDVARTAGWLRLIGVNCTRWTTYSRASPNLRLPRSRGCLVYAASAPSRRAGGPRQSERCRAGVWGKPITPNRGVTYHSSCGDRYGWVPPHQKALFKKLV